MGWRHVGIALGAFAALFAAELCGEWRAIERTAKPTYDRGFKDGALELGKAIGPIFANGAKMMEPMTASLERMTAQRDQCLRGLPIKDADGHVYRPVGGSYPIRGNGDGQ